MDTEALKAAVLAAHERARERTVGAAGLDAQRAALEARHDAIDALSALDRTDAAEVLADLLVLAERDRDRVLRERTEAALLGSKAADLPAAVARRAPREGLRILGLLGDPSVLPAVAEVVSASEAKKDLGLFLGVAVAAALGDTGARERLSDILSAPVALAEVQYLAPMLEVLGKSTDAYRLLGPLAERIVAENIRMRAGSLLPSVIGALSCCPHLDARWDPLLLRAAQLDRCPEAARTVLVRRAKESPELRDALLALGNGTAITALAEVPDPRIEPVLLARLETATPDTISEPIRRLGRLDRPPRDAIENAVAKAFAGVAAIDVSAALELLEVLEGLGGFRGAAAHASFVGGLDAAQLVEEDVSGRRGVVLRGKKRAAVIARARALGPPPGAKT